MSSCFDKEKIEGKRKVKRRKMGKEDKNRWVKVRVLGYKMSENQDRKGE